MNASPRKAKTGPEPASQGVDTGAAQLASGKIYSRLGDDLRPRSLEKYRSILAAASTAFITEGFERTSMDSIAEASGVSKRTVYGHFETKHALFVAVIETLCDRVIPPPLDDHSIETAPVEEVLTAIGKEFLQRIYADEQIELFRTVITDARRFPELGAVMFDGPVMHSEEVVAAYLRRLSAANRIKLRSPELAAAQFMGMLKTNLHVKLLMKPDARSSNRAIRSIVESCVDIFLNGVRPR